MAQFELQNLETLAAGERRLYTFDGNHYLVYRLSDGFYATSHQCTHLFKSLAKGVIVSDTAIRCPLHRAEFDIRTGEVMQWACFPPGVQLLNALRPEKALATYPVSQQDGCYWLNV